MKKPVFLLNQKDPSLQELVEKTNKLNLAIWALVCAARILPYFESQFPEDPRPGQALAALQDWIDTGEFSMKTIRRAALATDNYALQTIFRANIDSDLEDAIKAERQQ